MYCSNKRQRIEQVLNVLSLNKWVITVKEAGFVLGKIERKTATSPSTSSRSVLQANLLALEMKALLKDANIDVLITNVPKGEQNRNPIKKNIPFSVHLMVYPVAQRRSVLRRSGGTSGPKIVTGRVTKCRFSGPVISRVSTTRRKYRFQ